MASTATSKFFLSAQYLYWAYLLALSSMDAWMENMIKKKEKKGKVTEIVTESSDNGIDPFKEYNRYINQPRLIRDDCPNPIS